MKILLIGRTGQLGYELERSLQCLGHVVAMGRREIDLIDLDQVRTTIRNVRPELIVNAAGYTAVDTAETESTLAMRINADAPGVIAEEVKRVGGAIIHYSSDYVFDGKKADPYVEEDLAYPINVYGQSKLLGEQAIQAVGTAHLIIRISWIYGMRGHNFLRTVQRLAQDHREIRVVADQYGAPTWSRTIADATAHAIKQLSVESSQKTTVINGARNSAWHERSGIYHLAAQGQTSWYGFAQAIVASMHKELELNVIPIETRDFPMCAARPANSILSCMRWLSTFGSLPDWKTGLRLCQN
jgi:dTDP-4-dehydrorhamnose reductase